jgi:hypothetical protein
MKKYNHTKKVYILIFVLLGLYSACKYDVIPAPPAPILPKATDSLNAVYVKIPPNSINSSYWSTANYHNVTCVNLSTNNLYPDGLMNMTGTFTGISSFNGDVSAGLIMKAAYDSLNLYILLQWNDNALNIQNSTWYYNYTQEADPLNSSESFNGWTGENNNEHVSLAFQIQPATGAGGTFSNVGCQASCHGSSQMALTSGSMDIWNWSAALSEPMGYAGDMVLNAGSNLGYDAGNPTFVRNNAGSTNRSGPAYSWNGALQNVHRGSGAATTLDPAYFLLGSNKAPLTGNVVIGDSAYQNATYGCWQCHGNTGLGSGPTEQAVPFINNTTVARKGWSSFAAFASGNTSTIHDGAPYWVQMDSAQQIGVYTYIMGFVGVPGYYLQEPTGSNADIISESNVNMVQVNKLATGNIQYKVLLIRKLNTGNPDDAVFTPSQNPVVPFGIALMGNDGINHIGSFKETLQFLKK